MRRRIGLCLVFVLTLTILCMQTVHARAQSSVIYILPDGSVSPSMAPIKHAGDVYRLTGNLDNVSLFVERSNIVVDGQGFTVQGPGTGIYNTEGICLNCTNVTLTNFYITGWQWGIMGVRDDNTIIGNNITGNLYTMAIYASNYNITGNYLAPGMRLMGDNNIISENEISLVDYYTGFWINNSNGTVIEANDVTFTTLTNSFIASDNGGFRVCHNNFLNIQVNTGGAFLLIIPYQQTRSLPFTMDNGYPSGGNFWSDYVIRYPNASEIDNSGIGNIPYSVAVAPNIIDNYPLISPFDFPKPQIVAQQNLAATPTLTSTSTPTATTEPSSSSSTPRIPEFSSVAILLVSAALFLVGVFFKRRS